MIKKYDLSSVPEFADYTGGADFDAAVKYFQDKFAAIAQSRLAAAVRPAFYAVPAAPP